METNANQKVCCTVNYAYDASEPDELTIRPGEVVRDVERLSGGWWRGELRGRRGMFPDNFVSLIETNSNNTRPSSAGVQGRCRAVFSYQPANPDELPLCVGDVLDVIGEVEEGWWQGRRQGRLGVFPSNFVVMLDAAPNAAPPAVPAPPDPAPALPPKPVKELCRVLFPYSAVNEDELTLSEGDIVTILSKDAPDRGWWRGELYGRVGLFPDNFVQIIPTSGAPELEEKKPERPPAKTANSIYPILNKYSEKTSSVKELTTTKTSMHKENSLGKESSMQITHTNKNDSEKLIHTDSYTDGQDGSLKKPPVPLKKSPTPNPGVGGLFSGLKSKMMSTEKEKSTATSITTTTSISTSSVAVGSVASSGSSSSGELDRPDGTAASRPSTFDHVERNAMLNDPRAGRVKAPRRRPPSQALRDDVPLAPGLSNGHEAEKPQEKEKAEEIKPRTREWEKHKAPWMEELKLNQAKKTSFGETKSRSVSSSSESGVASKAGGGSTDRILDCGVEEKRTSHSMEMSKSTSSISSKMSVMDSFEETTKMRHSLEPKKDTALPVNDSPKPTVQSPTAAGRTLTTMLEDIKKPQAPTPPAATARTFTDFDKSPSHKSEVLEKHIEVSKSIFHKDSQETKGIFHKDSHQETKGIFQRESHQETKEEKHERPLSGIGDKVSTLERRIHSSRNEKGDSDRDALITQLVNRISSLEKQLEVQNEKFTAAIDDLTAKLNAETERRLALQTEMEKLAHCVTQV